MSQIDRALERYQREVAAAADRAEGTIRNTRRAAGR